MRASCKKGKEQLGYGTYFAHNCSMKTIYIIFILLSFGALAQNHYFGPKIGFTSTSGAGNYKNVRLGEIGVSYSYKPSQWFSLYVDPSFRPSAFRDENGIKALNAYVSVPTYGSINIAKNKTIVAFDAGVINSYGVWGNDRFLGEVIAGLRAGRRGDKTSIEGYWHIGESFTKNSGSFIQTNFVGVQVLFKL